MNFCRNCGKVSDGEASFCISCGAGVGTGQHYCPDCGVSTAGGAFCSACGRSLLEGGMTHEAFYQEPVHPHLEQGQGFADGQGFAQGQHPQGASGQEVAGGQGLQGTGAQGFAQSQGGQGVGQMPPYVTPTPNGGGYQNSANPGSFAQGTSGINSPYLGPKSKLAAALLGIFLGGFGVHNFYLGKTTPAIIQVSLGVGGILLSCCTAGFSLFLTSGASIWGFVEGILILTDTIRTDGQGRLLRD